MKIGRRGFLGLFGAAAVSGPGVAAQTLTDLRLKGVGAVASLAPGEVPAGGVVSDSSWAVTRLAKRELLSALQLEEKRRTFHIHSLDANTASLRSVSLAAKIRISQERQFKESFKNEKEYLKRVIAGVEDFW